MTNRPLLFVMTLALPAAACALPEAPDFDDSATRGLINGSPPDGAVPNLVNIPGCSASLLAPQWVVTAGHCWGAGQLSVTQGNTTIVTDQRFQMPGGVDFTLGHLQSPFAGIPPLSMWPDQPSSLEGKTVQVFGRGGTGGPYNQGMLPVQTTNQPNGYVLNPGPNGERITPGDSGGPGFVLDGGINYLTGVTSAGGPGAGTQVSAPHFRKFADQSLFGPASDRGGGLSTGIALAEVVPGFLNAFAVGNDGNFYFQAKDLGTRTWGNWLFAFGPPPGGASSDPAAATASGQTYLFVRGGDLAIWVKIRNSSGQWSAWQSIGGVGTSGPGATAGLTSSGASIFVYVRGQDGNIYQQIGTVSGSSAPSWGGWTFQINRPAAGSSTSAPAAVVATAGDFGRWVFIRGADNRVYYKRFNLVTGNWTDWESLGGNTTFGVAAVSYQPNRVDVFAVGGNTVLWHRVFEGRWWTQPNHENESWIEVPTSLISNTRPAAVAPAGRAPEMEIAARGSFGTMWVQTYAF